MEIVYTDKNYRLKDFGELVDSQIFRNYIDVNLPTFLDYGDDGLVVQEDFVKRSLNLLFNKYGFKIEDSSKQPNNINSSNMKYVLDKASEEYIGAICLTPDRFSNMYCFAADINGNKVSNTYLITNDELRLIAETEVDWAKYDFIDSLEEKFKRLAETIYDISFMAGYLFKESAILIEDSRELRDTVIALAKEFEDENKGVNWDEKEKGYIEAIDEFAVDRLTEKYGREEVGLSARISLAKEKNEPDINSKKNRKVR